MTQIPARKDDSDTRLWLAPWGVLLLLLVPCMGAWANGPDGAERVVPWIQESDSHAPPAPERGAQQGSVQVVLLRHAEKELDQGSDPELTAQGQGRARRLAQLFQNAGATHFFASQYRRTQDTLAPWAKAAGSKIEVVRAQDPDRLIQLLRNLPPGSLAAVSGHSNTIPDLVQRLGGALSGLNEKGWLPDGEYSRLFVLTIPVGNQPEDPKRDCPSSLLELSF